MVIMCFILLLSAPMTVNAGSMATYVRNIEKMNSVGYIQQTTYCRALPSTKAKALSKLKVNTAVRYRKFDKNWAIAVCKNRVVFIPLSRLKQSKYTPKYFKRMGVIKYNGRRWTWYSQRVLPGGGLKIPGRHVDSRGFVCDGNEYICLASNNIKKGRVIDTPFGKKGKIYDSGCSGVDVYVNW